MSGRVRFAVCLSGALVSLFVSSMCFAAGFALWEGSARGDALGQAVVGRADDPSALFYNPAGITQLPGLQVMAGLTAIDLGADVTTRFGSQSTDNWGFPPHFYVTCQATDRLWFGLGIFTPFGLKVDFPQNWFGAFNSSQAKINSFTINPNVALKLTDQLSIAVGLEAMYFKETLKQLFPAPPLPADLSPTFGLEGDEWGYGFNLAAHYKPCQYFSAGVSYRSEVRQSGDLSAELTQNPVTHLPSFATTAHSELTLPDSVAFGFTFYPTQCLSWEIGGVWTRWSEFNQLQFAFDPVFPVAGVTVPKDWHDTWRFQTGLEYKACPWLDLRVGYIYDQEAINFQFADYLLPSNNRHYFSFGPGFHWCKWTLDLSYTYVLVEDKTITNSLSPGYINPTSLSDGHAHLIGVSVGYKF